MRLLTKIMPSSFNLFLFGDEHIGAVHHCDKSHDKLVNMMNAEYSGVKSNYGVSHGDCIEAICVDDPRFEMVTTKEMSIIQQMAMYEKKQAPIKHMLVGELDGNHPAKLWRFGNVTQEIASRLGVNFLTYTAKIAYHDRHGEIFKHFCSHGFGSINSTADDAHRQQLAVKIALKKKLKKKASDCALMSMGHTHKLIICEPAQELCLTDNGEDIEHRYTGLVQNGPIIPPDSRYYVNTGSFLKLHVEGISGYAEKAGYDPVELGFCVVRVRDRKIEGVDKIIS